MAIHKPCEEHQSIRTAALGFLFLCYTLASCTAFVPRDDRHAPYPRSQVITMTWDFSMTDVLRKANGSDIWALAWAADGNLYGAWGDGSGFHSDPGTGPWKVSLGVSRILGIPAADDPASISGQDVWGSAPQFAENQATFGGKVGSLISIDGVLYGYGHLWTDANVHNAEGPAKTFGAGPLHTLIWSQDLGKSWQIASWDHDLSGTFLQFGQDNRGARDEFVYVYYNRPQDARRVYLKRIRATNLTQNPHTSGSFEFLRAIDARHHRASWSRRERDAIAVFRDGAHVDVCDALYDAPIDRFLLVTGHNRTGLERDSAAGKIGVFEAPYPWGPWATVGYYDDLGALDPSESHGDFLGLRFPIKWISADGTTLWAVFSSMGRYDSLNVAKATLQVKTATIAPNRDSR